MRFGAGKECEVGVLGDTDALLPCRDGTKTTASSARCPFTC